jgi:hypothetical protein
MRTPAGRVESETSLTELFEMLAVDMLVDMGLFPLSMVLGHPTGQI